jgi:hypothetical protein
MTVSKALMTVHDMVTLVTVYDSLAGSVVFCVYDEFDASRTETTFFQSPDPDLE